MDSQVAKTSNLSWLKENGAAQLEALFRAIVFYPSSPILIADDNCLSLEASLGASELLGLPRLKIIGRRLDDFAIPEAKSQISRRWRAFLEEREQSGTLDLLNIDGTPRQVDYIARRNVLPVRHLILLKDKADVKEASKTIRSWVRDYALSLLNFDGQIVAWYGGAERIWLREQRSHRAACLIASSW